MTGLYIHIPFCRQKCLYCAFYSVAARQEEYREAYAEALVKEAEYFKEYYFGGKPATVSTLYIGGGTPSLLPVSFYTELLEKLSARFDLSALEEVTFEANPEHLSAAYLSDLYRYTPVRRLSIGVQSFADADLKALNRRHSGAEALQAIESARAAGFENISIDLIYGIHPETGHSTWPDNLNRLQSLDLPHFSAYALTVEAGTMLERRLAMGKMRIAGEEGIETEYFQLQEFASRHGYEAYEISNYARHGAYGMHNRNYWRDIPYIGLGAAAHSYIGSERHWNQASVQAYIADPVGGKERECLSERDRYHEYIMTALRTRWGVEEEKIAAFAPALREEFRQRVENEIKCGNLQRENGAYTVPPAKRLLTDGIAASFF
ncbi:MAG: radical SAM family heme chaperone HemW [Bacteroides sp.]|nr:radical SAM family heme chaperone HemW [Ruminococcus flavefaciens]MCM1554583.1 radical SAM family heme chaperone HemW [Bacteroides sp.]